MEFIIDAFIDTAKIIPFLIITYIIIEWIEHKASSKLILQIQKSSRFGPVVGSAFGLIPQCGFSSIASSLYVTRVLTLGTLIAVYLSTSDEMLPILLSNHAPLGVIVKILSIKFIVGVVAGYFLDGVIKNKKSDQLQIDNFCNDENCDCEQDGIFVSALKHAMKIALYIFLITVLLNVTLSFVELRSLLVASPILTVVVSAIVGLVPNCAVSIALTQLYLDGMLSFGGMMAGLLSNAGVGLLVLFRINKDYKENFKIVFYLLGVAILVGLVV